MIDPIDRNTALGITEECAKSLKWILGDEDLSESERKECEWKLSFVESIISDLKNVPSIAQRQEPCEDAVSRADVLECFADLYDTFEDCSKGIINELHRKFEDLRTLPSVTPKPQIGELVVRECDDAVSRLAVRHALCKAVHKDEEIPCENQTASCLWSKTRVCDCVREIDALPPVTPKRKTGKWIHEIVNNYTEKTYCSECGESAPFVLVSDDYYGVHVHGEVRKTDFCPNCGVKLDGSE